MIEDLKKAKNIGIIVSNYEGIDHVATALSLFLIVKKLNKPVYYKANESLPIVPLLPKSTPQIVLTVEKEIEDIFYEKTEKNIKLFLTPKEKNISLSDFTCNIMNLDQSACCDIIIAIGFNDFEELEKAAASDFENLHNADIINIDNNVSNKKFGKTNLVEENSSLSKILFDNLEEEIIDKNIASILISGLKENELNTIKELGEKGGKLDTKYKLKSLVFTLNSMETEEDIYISQIDGLLETPGIPFILQIIKEYFLVPNFILIFKENCIFYLENEKILEKIKNAFNPQIKNNGGMFTKADLSKEEVLNILK
ncbi:MAG: hypothetical protein PHY30_02095 [Candidatus Pacebacteria bacterium]|nr:hypothetical protein [Candidatus Paceibacterota bacterium]